MIAIVAGRGSLPRLLAEAERRERGSALILRLPDIPLDWVAEGDHVIDAIYEKPGRAFAALREAGADRITFAGAVDRPKLRPLKFDLTMLKLAPRMLPAMRKGDDALLRTVTNIFEERGLTIIAPHDALEGLLAAEGVMAGTPSEADREDAARAAELVRAIGAADVGQAAVVAQGVCLGLESIQGTDAMLAFVAETGAPHRIDPAGGRGVLHKAPKPGQDWRIDLPAIGPDTVASAKAAGLAGISVEAGGVLVLGREETVAAAEEAGLFLWGRPA